MLLFGVTPFKFRDEADFAKARVFGLSHSPLSPPPLQKFSPDFYVLRGPHWAARGVLVRTPRPATPLSKVMGETVLKLNF